MGPVSSRRTSLRRTALFTLSTQSFCPRTGNCWPPRPDDCLSRRTLVRLEGPVGGAFILAQPSHVERSASAPRGSASSYRTAPTDTARTHYLCGNQLFEERLCEISS